MRKYNAIIIAGSWAAGKTTLALLYGDQFKRDGIPFTFDSDRLQFEQGVLGDVTNYNKDQKRWEGPHSYLTKDGNPGSRQFMIRDGTIANQAHMSMIAEIAQLTDGDPLRLVEYAIGPDIHEFENERREPPFLQAGRHLVDWLNQSGILDKVLLIEMISSLQLRFQRQRVRDSKTDQAAFEAFAGGGGGLNGELSGDNYVRFENDHNDARSFRIQAASIYRDIILPGIQGEGNQRSIERRRR
ncbi:MAG: hypothetical protein AAB874_01385 [Patescibacteria group bacterium]